MADIPPYRFRSSHITCPSGRLVLTRAAHVQCVIFRSIVAIKPETTLRENRRSEGGKFIHDFLQISSSRL
ncbi:hypothetical protein GOODEAATRI_021442, partial [Goodea atripinnis]